MAPPSSLMDAIKLQFPSYEELRNPRLIVLSNYTNLFMFIFFIGVAVFQFRRGLNEAKKLPRHSALRAPGFPIITEREKFDWQKAEPVKLRSFKPKLHLKNVDASALEPLDPKDLLEMDKNYKSRIDYRRKIIQDNPSVAIGVKDDKRIRPAVLELYTFLFGTYLPLRYPDLFRIHHTNFEYGKDALVENRITGEMIPTKGEREATRPVPTTTLLSNLGRHIDEDFLFLRRENEVVEDAKYVLDAYSVCGPSGWDPVEKLGKKVAEIHGPVPAYGKKVDGTMNKVFQDIEVGEYVKRDNWSATLGGEIFTPLKKGGDVEEFSGDLDPENTFVRCERQTVHRLPRSKMIVFAYKTYLYSIREIKEEGLGKELAEAIDDLKGGTLPETAWYKKGAEWGDAVKKYLSS